MEVEGCALPDDRLYDLEHEVWWQPEGAGSTARLGVMATFAAFAGRFTSVAYRPVSGPLEAGRSVATVESVRLTGAVRLPVGAEILERNERVVGRPRLLNDEPYADGWLVRVKVTGTAPAADLLSAAAAAPLVRALIGTRRVRCWPLTPEVELTEIGLECSAVLVKLDEEIARRSDGDAVLLVTDDPTSPIEMVRWSDRSGHRVLAHRREGELHQFLVQRVGRSGSTRPAG